MFTRFFIYTILASGLLSLSVQAQNLQPDSTNAPATQPGWLGAWVQPLPVELRAQLASLIKSGEGLMINSIEPNSPAASAGLRRFDVLLSFNGQKLYSTEQLSSLVYHTKTDESVALKVIQQGQLRTINTRLAPRKSRTLARTERYPYPGFPYYQPTPPPMPRVDPAPDNTTAWDMFESVEVKTLPDGRYRAIVSYKDAANEVNTFTFEGLKEEIIQQVQTLPELPPAKKRALLKALNMSADKGFPLDRFGWDSNLFNAPFSSIHPFDHPFFKDPYFLNRPFAPPGYQPAPYVPPWQLHLYPNGPDWNKQP